MKMLFYRQSILNRPQHWVRMIRIHRDVLLIYQEIIINCVEFLNLKIP